MLLGCLGACGCFKLVLGASDRLLLEDSGSFVILEWCLDMLGCCIDGMSLDIFFLHGVVGHGAC